MSNHEEGQPVALSPAKKPPIPPLLALGAGIAAASMSAILIRWAQSDAPSLVIAAGRTSLATLFLLPLALTRRRNELRALPGSSRRWALLAGIMLGLHFASWINSLAYTTVLSSTVLFATAPFWVALASPWVLGERISRPAIVGIALAFAGSAVIAVDSLGEGQQSLLGNGLALLGAICYAAYFLIGRRLRVTLSLLSYTTLVYGSAALFLLLAVWLGGFSLGGYSLNTYLLILLMAIFPQLLGHTSYNYALGYLPAVYVAIASIGEPIGATVLAAILLQEAPDVTTLVGGALILTGILVAERRAQAAG